MVCTYTRAVARVITMDHTWLKAGVPVDYRRLYDLLNTSLSVVDRAIVAQVLHELGVQVGRNEEL